jgi:hypothetical protein
MLPIVMTIAILVIITISLADTVDIAVNVTINVPLTLDLAIAIAVTIMVTITVTVAVSGAGGQILCQLGWVYVYEAALMCLFTAYECAQTICICLTWMWEAVLCGCQPQP